MNVLFFSDPHISLNSIEELSDTFQWIFDVAKKEKVDTVVMLGDYYDKKTPHIKAFLFGTEWASKFKNEFEKVIFLRGNHDNVQDTSNLDYLQYFGIEIVDDCIVEGIYCGHFFTDKSPISYGKKIHPLKKLKKKGINYILLGHYHDFCEISKNAYHIGSVRFTSFGETEDKIIAIYKKKKLEFIKIPTVIPAITVYSFDELEKINKKTKVRLIIKDFENYKKIINKLDKYKKKFVEFKIKIDFVNENVIKPQASNNLEDFIKEWLDKQDKDVVKLLLEVFKEKGMLEGGLK